MGIDKGRKSSILWERFFYHFIWSGTFIRRWGHVLQCSFHPGMLFPIIRLLYENICIYLMICIYLFCTPRESCLISERTYDNRKSWKLWYAHLFLFCLVFGLVVLWIHSFFIKVPGSLTQSNDSGIRSSYSSDSSLWLCKLISWLISKASRETSE